MSQLSKSLGQFAVPGAITTLLDDHCHGKSQQALKYVLDLYDKILFDYKKGLPNCSTPTPATLLETILEVDANDS